MNHRRYVSIPPDRAIELLRQEVRDLRSQLSDLRCVFFDFKESIRREAPTRTWSPEKRVQVLADISRTHFASDRERLTKLEAKVKRMEGDK